MYAVYGNKMGFEMRGLWHEQRRLGEILVHGLAIDNFADLWAPLIISIGLREAWRNAQVTNSDDVWWKGYLHLQRVRCVGSGGFRKGYGI